MRLGELNTLCTIEHKTREQDDLENRPAVWAEFAKCFCKAMAPNAGSETQPNQQTTSTTNWTFETHWTIELAKVTTAMRWRLPDGRVLGIKSVVNEELASRKLIFTCEEQS